MKKFLLSFFVIAVFVAYIFSLRNQVSVTPNLTGSDSNIPPTSEGVPSGNNTVPTVNVNKGTSKNYKDGEYTGDVIDAYYGNVQIKASIKNGKITDVQFLDYPKDRGTSVEINSQAMPILKSEAINAQSANVDIVSGATQTSEAFIESLTSALTRAKI